MVFHGRFQEGDGGWWNLGAEVFVGFQEGMADGGGGGVGGREDFRVVVTAGAFYGYRDNGAVLGLEGAEVFETQDVVGGTEEGGGVKGGKVGKQAGVRAGFQEGFLVGGGVGETFL